MTAAGGQAVPVRHRRLALRATVVEEEEGRKEQGDGAAGEAPGKAHAAGEAATDLGGPGQEACGRCGFTTVRRGDPRLGRGPAKWHWERPPFLTRLLEHPFLSPLLLLEPCFWQRRGFIGQGKLQAQPPSGGAVAPNAVPQGPAGGR